MFVIKWSPIRLDTKIGSMFVSGDTITIDGVDYDFTELGEGEILPDGSTSSDLIVSSIKRINGEIHFTMLLPHGPPPEVLTGEEASVYYPELLLISDGFAEIPELKYPAIVEE